MRTRLFQAGIAALAYTISTAAQAETPVTLRDALSTVPVGVLETDQPYGVIAKVVNLSAARALIPATGDTFGFPHSLSTSLGRKDAIRPFAEWSTPQGMMGEWEKQAGVPITRVAAFVGFGDTPRSGAIWIMAGDADAARVFDGLAGRGFSPLDGGVLINGEPGNIAIDRLSPGDPWLGSNGLTSAVGRSGRLLIQSAYPEPVRMAQSATPATNLTSSPPVDTALKGVEAVTDGRMLVVQALLAWPVAIGVTQDMLDAKGQGGPAVQKDGVMPGLPAYSAALVADIQATDRRWGAAISLVYQDCTVAAEGGRRFVERWKTVPFREDSGQPMSQLIPAEIATRTVEADGGCAAVITITAAMPPTADPQMQLGNPIAALVSLAIQNRNFVAATMSLD